MTEWRELRDAGVLEGKKAGETIGKPPKDQAEIARLRRQLQSTERRLETSEGALLIMGKLQAGLVLHEVSLDSAPKRARYE